MDSEKKGLVEPRVPKLKILSMEGSRTFEDEHQRYLMELADWNRGKPNNVKVPEIRIISMIHPPVLETLKRYKLVVPDEDEVTDQHILEYSDVMKKEHFEKSRPVLRDVLSEVRV